MTHDSLLSQQDDQIQIDENKDYLAELVGEGKKFKDNQALAKAKAYSDAHIVMLERRFDELSADYVKQRDSGITGAKLQALLDKLDATQQQLTSRETTQNSNGDTQPSSGVDDVDSLISSKIQQHEQSKLERENYSKVEAKLKERLGTNYKSVLKDQAQSLGLTDEDVNLMARKNPSLFFKTFDLNALQGDTSFQSPLKSNSPFTPKGAEKRTWSYYQKLKETNPKIWLDRKIAIQMEKDSQALGAAFFDA